MGIAPAEQVAEIFVELADTSVDEFDLIEFLHQVTSRTSSMVDTSAAGLLLADRSGQLQFMAASDEQTKLVELFQVQATEGPCQDCFRLGTPVVNADLREGQARWPRFAPMAVAAGFRSVHALPLRLRKEVIGALNLFGTIAGPMAASEARVVQALADVATIAILQERAIHRGEILTEQLQTALNSRVTIEQAKGALSQIRGCTPDEAFDLIRKFCRSHNRRLGDVAVALTSDLGSIPGLTDR